MFSLIVDSLLLSPELHAQLVTMVLVAGKRDHERDWQRKRLTASRQAPHSYLIVLFRESRDGRSPNTFKALCDGRKPTVTVARVTDGPLVGGYTSAAVARSNDTNYEADATVRAGVEADQGR